MMLVLFEFVAWGKGIYRIKMKEVNENFTLLVLMRNINRTF